MFSKKIAGAIEKAVPCNRVGVAVIGLEVPHAHVHLIPLNSVEDIKSLTVPILFSQVRKDQYTFNESLNKNDLEEIIEACPTNSEVVWIGPEEATPYGEGKRFEGYGYFNQYPEELLSFLEKNI